MSYGKIGVTTVDVTQDLLSGMRYKVIGPNNYDRIIHNIKKIMPRDTI